MPTREELLAQYPFPRVIDNTLYELWKTCPHKFFRQGIQGLQIAEMGEPGTPAKVKPSIHLHFGGCMAKGLEVTRREYYGGGAGYNEAVACGGEAIIKEWADFQFSPRTRTEEAKTLDNCILAHEGYFRHWDMDDPIQQVMLVNDQPLVELSGARPIDGTLHPETGEPILYAGRFDAILDNLNIPVGLDDKTTGGSLGDGWQEQWDLRGQFTGYIWLAEAWGYHIEQFFVHGIQVLKTKINYAEALQVRPPWMVNRWLNTLRYDIDTMVGQYELFLTLAEIKPERLQQASPFPQAFGESCHHFNAPCSMARLCKEPNPEDYLDAYVVSRWDPLQRGQD